jgi:(p)ppGpp synthase/HD superfamily hydrolase
MVICLEWDYHQNRMNTPDLLERAIAIAVGAHKGQRDKYGAPYILHPIRVMGKVQTDLERIVAILHDIVEDTPWTFQALKKEGFSMEIMAALDSVTRREGEAYEKFVQRSARNPLGRRVKLADLEDNMDIRRLARVTEKDRARLNKYRRAWEMLTKE